MSKQRIISRDYKEFVTAATELADKEVPSAVSREAPEWRERYTLHLISMTKLHEVANRRPSAKPVAEGSWRLAFLVAVLLVVGIGIGYALCLALGGIFWC